MKTEYLQNKLKTLRKSYKLTQDEVAEFVGKERSIIAKYETGKAVPPLNVLDMFSKLYKISVDELCGYNEENNEPDNSLVFSDGKDDSLIISSLSPKEKKLILTLRLSGNDKAIDEIMKSML